MKFPLTEYFYNVTKEAYSFLENRGCVQYEEEADWEVDLVYESDNLTVTHSYGDREMLFNTVIRVKPRDPYGYALWEWVNVLEYKPQGKISDNLISDEKHLEALVKTSADCLQKILDQIINAGPEKLNALEAARNKVRKEWEAKYK